MIMDYAIYEAIEGGKPRPIHVFTQKGCNHKAKDAARKNCMTRDKFRAPFYTWKDLC